MTKRIVLLIMTGILCTYVTGARAADFTTIDDSRRTRLLKADDLYEESTTLMRTFERELRAILRQSRRAVRDELTAIYAVLRIDPAAAGPRVFRECVAPQGVCDKGSCCVGQR